jgi:hypothetical protein
MKIKNTYMSTIGFGHVTALPNEVVELPDGFDESHPCILFYLSRKWIEVVDEKPANNTDGNISARKSRKELKRVADELGVSLEPGKKESTENGSAE